jgi:hypothetical protein
MKAGSIHLHSAARQAKGGSLTGTDRAGTNLNQCSSIVCKPDQGTINIKVALSMIRCDIRQENSVFQVNRKIHYA